MSQEVTAKSQRDSSSYSIAQSAGKINSFFAPMQTLTIPLRYRRMLPFCQKLRARSEKSWTAIPARLSAACVERLSSDGQATVPTSNRVVSAARETRGAAARWQQDQSIDCVDILPLQFQHRLFNLGLRGQVANDNSVASIGKDLQQLLFKGCGVTVNLPVLHQRLGADGGTADHDSDAQRGGELPAVRLKGRRIRLRRPARKRR